ncbi:glycoside hydrolase family 95 protein [Chitinophaga costaii]|nr:glycoside hydrolase family 95 protein [Chitinophaga costaii]PUZ30591.1 glycoside hydrolase family 95 protein [Chitinophaga costaii]
MNSTTLNNLLSNKIRLAAIALLALFISNTTLAQQKDIAEKIADKTFNPSTLLWYNKPAAKWEDALPVGNGRLGAMVFGTTGEETIQFNEDTYWSGGPYSTVVKGGYRALPEVQKLVREGEYLKAHNLFGRALMGYPVEQQKYQSLAELHIFFPNKESTDYKRWLDLETGITAVSYKTGNVLLKEEVFASAPHQVVAIRFTADKKGSISFKAQLRGVRNQAHSNYATDYFRMDGSGTDGLVVTGKSADYLGVEGKLRYEARIKAVAEGGTVTVDNGELTVKEADAVTLYFLAATNFVNYKDVSADQHQRTEDYLSGITGKTYETLKQAHLSDYESLFNRVKMELPVSPLSYLPTDLRKSRNLEEPDASLAALAYQFGRYLLIASSRPGTEPANLQGIWNNGQNPMWDAKYTTNINTQMNYWIVESANLSECAAPLIRMVKELTDQGAQVAKEHYGCRGWVFHQNTDLWRVAAPMDGPTWGTFTVGGAWLCTHLWEHYLYTQDTAYLKDIYPVIKGAVQFFADFLTPDASGKWLVTNPSTSPENFPARPGNGRYFDEVTGSYLPGTSICAGSAIDMEILSDLFKYYIAAAGVLHTDGDFAGQVAQLRGRLLPPQVSQDGTLQEWAQDWPQSEHPHRHISHLYGLYPGDVFSLQRTPQWIAACRKSLIQRGDGSAEWARPWKAAMWSRLMEGDHAYRIIKGYFKEESNPQFFGNAGFPIQVDGPLGIAAAISEMLVQSQDSVISLLPALPQEWSSGSIQGFKARGGFNLSFSWTENKLQKLDIRSVAGKPCVLKMQPGNRYAVYNAAGKQIHTKETASHTLQFETIPGENYRIKIM